MLVIATNDDKTSLICIKYKTLGRDVHVCDNDNDDKRNGFPFIHICYVLLCKTFSFPFRLYMKNIIHYFNSRCHSTCTFE